jgi:hypothetical protein
MKKNLTLILVLVSLLAILFTMAASAPDITVLKLKETKFEPGKGVVLIFEITGKARKPHYEGTIFASGNPYGMNCTVDDNSELVCVVGDAISQIEGQSVTGRILGFRFETVVPIKVEANSQSASCTGYSVSTEEGWDYIFENLEDMTHIVETFYGEHPIAGTMQCYQQAWSPNLTFDGVSWFEQQ